MKRTSRAAVSADVRAEALRRIAERFGTPTYAYNLGTMRRQLDRLDAALPPQVELLYSLKANPSLGICCLLAERGLGADVASVGELATSLAAGFRSDRIYVAGPHLAPDLLDSLRPHPEAVLSIDSQSELERIFGSGSPHRLLLRLRPDFETGAVVDAGAGSRFGIGLTDLERRADRLEIGTRVTGFHVYSGSQILDAAAVVRHLRGACDLSLRAAEILGTRPGILNLGGGFGVPYARGEHELSLSPIAEELAAIQRRVAPSRIVLELGRFLVAQAGWYLTRVVAQQTHQGRPAVVVDGGSHQRADLCGLGLRSRASPPIVLAPADAMARSHDSSATRETDVLGCLCLPDDILAQASQLPLLEAGTVLAFPNAGAYGPTAAPQAFLGHPSAAEVAFEDRRLTLLRKRGTAACLAGQRRLDSKSTRGESAPQDETVPAPTAAIAATAEHIYSDHPGSWPNGRVVGHGGRR